MFLSGFPSSKAMTSAEDAKCSGCTSVGKIYENVDQVKAPVSGQQKKHYP
jgi:hypothetical protein